MAERSLEVRVRLTRAGEHATGIDVAFEAPPGITILFGPSGSGKSTTLAAVAGLLRPDEGRIALGSEIWFDSAGGLWRPVELRGVAFVFQSLALFPHMTAAGNVEYGIDRAVPRPERARRARATLDRMRVGHLFDRRPSTFSGGEAQRVALARALARSPALVLLDEPFSAMDRELRRELCADLRTAIDELRIPAIMVTHHRNEVRALGDRIVVLAAGRVQAAGGVSEVLAGLEPTSEVRPSGPGRSGEFEETPLGELEEDLR
jgi:molybdate transport system ATP-binding protein